VIDCGALSPSLIESELFGHERGAYTGAHRARRGAFEAASGGTLFLDEVGELPLELQPKLLRVLESGEVRRLGGSRTLKVDVRIVAATNRQLRLAVNSRRFRPDLYYRLAVVRVELPPLRERLEDLPLLVEALAEGLGGGRRPELRDERWLAQLRLHDWPGNVRELRNRVERRLTVETGEPAAVAEGMPTLREARRAFERRYLEDLLRAHGERVSAAARAAGVDRVFLYRMLWRAGLR
jgi:transcriptional regulator with PAS, ATPase and Fis domain